MKKATIFVAFYGIIIVLAGVVLSIFMQNRFERAELQKYQQMVGVAGTLPRMQKNILWLDKFVIGQKDEVAKGILLSILDDNHYAYLRLADGYNSDMESREYRFAYKDKLPKGAQNGPLPKKFFAYPFEGKK